MVSLPQHKDWKQETVKKNVKTVKMSCGLMGGLYAIVEAQITLPPGCSFLMNRHKR